jgi:hypothetical protein
MYRHGSKKVFASTHPVDKYTSVTLIGKGCILLEDSGMVGVRLLDCQHAGHLCSALKSRLNFEVDKAKEDVIYPLALSYGDRGDPYTSGVTLSLADVFVFLDKHEVCRLVKALS